MKIIKIMGSLFFSGTMETLFLNNLDNKQNGHRYIFLEVFFVCLFAYLFCLGTGKGEEKFYGYMNTWIFIWVIDFNNLLTRFR